MTSISNEKYISILIAILLLIQVFLTTILITRINKLDNDISSLREFTNSSLSQLSQSYSPQNNALDIPSYIENVSADDDPWKGTLNAPITIIEFADYQCPYCAAIAPVIDELLQEYGDEILYVYRDFPLEQHSNAFQAAEAAQCAGDQDQYWEMHNLLFANQENLDTDSLKAYATQLELDDGEFATCLDSGKYSDEIFHDMAQAREYQVFSTPVFFINGHRIIGPTPDYLRSVVREAIQTGG